MILGDADAPRNGTGPEAVNAPGAGVVESSSAC
mgnify:CR=1 FL=1